MVKMKKADFDKILKHAESVLPEEACGLIAGEITPDGKEIKKVYLLTIPTIPTSTFPLTPRSSLRR